MAEPKDPLVGYLTKAQVRALGFSRGDTDRVFDHLPLVALPGSRKAYVRVDDLAAWLDENTRVAPRRTAAA